jgi:HEAT repeat protein
MLCKVAWDILMCKLTFTWVLVILLAACGCAQPPQALSGKHYAGRYDETSKAPGFSPGTLVKKTTQLLEQLASEKYKDRENAQTELDELLRSGRGGVVLEHLRNACQTTQDPEVKQRLENILQPYNRWKITPAILHAIPNIVQLLEENSLNSMRTAVEALGKLPKEGIQSVLCSVVEFQIAALKDERDRVCKRTVAVLGMIGEPAVEPLLKTLGEETAVSMYAAEALSKIRGKKVITLLIRSLGNENSTVRRWAAWALGTIGDKRALEPLIKSLKDTSRYVRKNAVSALRDIGDKKAVMPLIEALKDSNEAVRGHAATALGELLDARAVGPLIEALKDKDDHVRLSAARALGDIGDKSAINPLRELWKDEEHRWVRVQIAYGLTKMAADVEALRFLIETLKDEIEWVRDSAACALVKATKHNPGYTGYKRYEKWKEWYENNKDK